jgi:hypothetical protein
VDFKTREECIPEMAKKSSRGKDPCKNMIKQGFKGWQEYRELLKKTVEKCSFAAGEESPGRPYPAPK